MDSVSPSYMEDLSNLDSMPSPPVEVWPLSSALFGAEPWVLRMCLVTPSLPNISSLQLDQVNVVALNAKAVAGKRHIVAGVHNLVRDFQAKRAAALAKDDNPSKAEEIKAKLSTHLPQAMFVKKHGSGITPESLFAPSETDPVVLVSVSVVPEENIDAITALVERMGLKTSPLSLIQPDVDRIQKAFDLSEAELADVEKAVTMRVASKDCM